MDGKRRRIAAANGLSYSGLGVCFARGFIVFLGLWISQRIPTYINASKPYRKPIETDSETQ
jgi:hypothetical protein